MSSCLIVSTALKPSSRTLVLAKAVETALKARWVHTDLMDLSAEPLPACDGAACYADPAVLAATERVKQAAAVVVCAPIYNYQVNSAAKNFLELTNSGWPEKIVGIVANAGSDRSFLSILSLLNSLWIDHHCLVVPRYVYATSAGFAPDGTVAPDGDIGRRIGGLSDEISRLVNLLGTPPLARS